MRALPRQDLILEPVRGWHRSDTSSSKEHRGPGRSCLYRAGIQERRRDGILLPPSTGPCGLLLVPQAAAKTKHPLALGAGSQNGSALGVLVHGSMREARLQGSGARLCPGHVEPLHTCDALC